MNTRNLTAAVGLVFLAVFCLGAFLSFNPKAADAKPSYFVRSPGTSSATTSPNYMSAGAATTTETFNTSNGSSQAMDSVALNLWVKSSTTPVNTNSFGTTTLSIRIEQSDNCVDYSLATSSTLQTSLTEQMGSAAIASTSMAGRVFVLPTPILKCVRALVGVQPGSSNNAAVWMQFIGKRENN